MAAKRELTPEQREAQRERQRRYNAKPEVQARRKAYYRQPEVLARYKARTEAGAQKEYMRQWRQSESGKRKLKESGLRQRGWTLELWETMIKLQGNKCAVCRSAFPDNYREIHADHCHESMQPRGLLCQPCNLAEGLIRKTGLDPEEFGRRLSLYVGNPPAARVGSESLVQAQLEERN